MARGIRWLIVILAGFGFLAWVFYFAGTTFSDQAEGLRKVVTAQFAATDGRAERRRAGPEGQSVTGRAIVGLGRQADHGAGQRIGSLTTAF